MEPHPWIDRIWFGAATVLFVIAALYPIRFLRVLNYGRTQGLPGPRAVLFFRLVAAFAAVGGIVSFILGRIG
jgi:hypothetical protein